MNVDEYEIMCFNILLSISFYVYLILIPQFSMILLILKSYSIMAKINIMFGYMMDDGIVDRCLIIINL